MLLACSNLSPRELLGKCPGDHTRLPQVVPATLWELQTQCLPGHLTQLVLLTQRQLQRCQQFDVVLVWRQFHAVHRRSFLARVVETWCRAGQTKTDLARMRTRTLCDRK